jgi:hypothetical protein
MENYSELTRLRAERDAARSQLTVEKQAHQRNVDQMRIDWASDTDRLRAKLTAERERLWKYGDIIKGHEASITKLREVVAEARDCLKRSVDTEWSRKVFAAIDAVLAETGDKP